MSLLTCLQYNICCGLVGCSCRLRQPAQLVLLPPVAVTCWSSIFIDNTDILVNGTWFFFPSIVWTERGLESHHFSLLCCERGLGHT